MHATLLFTAIALAGQVGNGAGGRYADLGTAPADPPPFTATAPAGQGSATAPQVPFAQPGQAMPAAPATNPIQNQPPSNPVQNQPSGSPFQDGNAGFDTGVTPLSSGPLGNGLQTTPVASSQLKPSQLLRSMLEEPLREKLVGTPWKLADVLQTAQSRGEQTRRVEAYWDLMAAVAQYNSSLQDIVRLQAVKGGVGQPSPQWERERQMLEARVQVAGRTAKVAQHRVQQMLGRSSNETLPLPSDLPHCGKYDTRYSEIFPGQSSKQAGQLNELVSLNYQALQREAEGVAAATQWLQTVSQTRDPNTDGRGLLKAYELLTLRRSAFVDAVRDYNVNIARYAEISTPGDIGRDRLMAMLLFSTREQRRSWGPEGIQQTSAEEPVSNQTFAPATESQSRRAETPQGVEHSILTPPGSGTR